MRKKILFVDDEPNILEGLKNRLFRQRTKWEMFFVDSGKAALAALAREPVDVIVSDMRMPEMDGATLLKEVQEKYPAVVRIVLSGHAELEASLRAVPVSHQFLSKPCEAGVLEDVVERACNLQKLINNEVITRMIGGLKNLPPYPKTYNRLVMIMNDENSSLDDVSEIIKHDMAICAKVLQLVNSSFFGISRTIEKVEQAVTSLGLKTITQVVLASEVFGNPRIRTHSATEALQQHSILVSKVTTRLLSDSKALRDTGVVVGLLHDIGKLILAVELPGQMGEVLREMKATDCPLHVAEERILGVTHAEIGGYLLGLWGLPYPIIEAVSNHHAPSRVDCASFGLLAAVHVANGLVQDFSGSERPDAKTLLDEAFLERVGCSERIEEWRELARRLVEEGN